MTCMVCGTLSVPGAHFCHNCGVGLSAITTEVATERRFVTVIFGDLSDFTAWSEDLDPERVSAVTDRLLAALAHAVNAFGGHVDKLTGDGIMAVFGAPIAHENDPERAVRAALAMKRAARQIVNEEEGGGRRLSLRVGINTGEVAASVQASLSYTVIGDTVNTAARLSDAAEIGCIYAGVTTVHATQDIAAWRQLTPLRLKGKKEPVDTYELLSIRDASGTRSGLGDEAPFIGREAEVGQVLGIISESADTQSPQIIMITGEAGIGKTRFTAEITRIVDRKPRGQTVTVRCSPFSNQPRWAVMTDIIRALCSISTQTARDEAISRVRRFLTRLQEEKTISAAHVDSLMTLIGAFETDTSALSASDPLPGSEASDPVVTAVAVTLAALASTGPLLLVIDDVHHLNSDGVDVVSAFLQRLQGSVIVALTGRYEPRSHSRPLLHQKPNAIATSAISIEPLPPRSMNRLLLSYLGEGDLPTQTAAQLITATQGNPFYLAELVTLLMEQGRLTGGHGGWHLAPDSLVNQLSSSDLGAVINARIDVLPMAVRAVLRDAAVIGTRVPETALRVLQEASAQPWSDTEAALTELIRRRMLRSSSNGGYVFLTTLLQQVAYSGMGKADLAERHARLARWANTCPERYLSGPQRDETLAIHSERALLLADQVQLSPHAEVRTVATLGACALERMAANALTVGDVERAVELTERALKLGPDGLSPAGLLVRGRALARSGRAKESLDVISSLLIDPALASDPDAEPVEPRFIDTRTAAITTAAWLIAAEAHRFDADLPAAADAGHRALALASRYELEREHVQALRHLGMIDYRAGWLRRAEKRFAEAYERATSTDDLPGRGWSLQHLAWVGLARGDVETADSTLRQAQQLFAGYGDSAGTAWATGAEAFVKLLQGQLTQARKLAEQFVNFGQNAGDSWSLAVLHTVDAYAAAELGQFDYADNMSKQATETFLNSGDIWGRSFALMVRGMVARDLGKLDLAAPLLAEAARVGRLAAHPLTVAIARKYWGYCHLEANRAAQAEQIARQTLEVLEPIDVVDSVRVGPQILLADSVRVQGDVDTALTLLSPIVEQNMGSLLPYGQQPVLTSYAQALWDSGDTDSAVKWAQAAVEKPAEELRSRLTAWAVLAAIAAEIGDIELADSANNNAQLLVLHNPQIYQLNQNITINISQSRNKILR